MAQAREEGFWLRGARGALRGIRHFPAAARPGWVVLVLQGYFSSTHVGPARLYVQLARRLQVAGLGVLRVDPHGVGDSDGDFDEATFESQLADYAQVATYLRAESPTTRIALLGHSLGANLAVRLSAVDPAVEKLVLVSPTVGPFSWPDRLVSKDEQAVLARDGQVERRATVITRAFLDACQRDDVFELAKRAAPGAVVLHPGADEYFDGSGARRLAAALPGATLVEVPAADHNALATGSRAAFLAAFDASVIERWPP